MTGFMPALEQLTGVPRSTLFRWRSTLHGSPSRPANSQWRPGPPRGHVNFGRRDETLDGMLRGIVDGRLNEKLPVTYQYVREQAIIIFRRSQRGDLPSAPADEDLDDEWNVSLQEWYGDDGSDDEELQERMALEIVDDDADGETVQRVQRAFSDHWVRDWIRHNGYSLGMAHNERRSKATREELRDREVAFEMDCRALFFDVFKSMRRFWWNMDETKMMFMMPRRRTIAHRGAEAVTVAYAGDPKASLTIICFVSAAGEKGPVIVLARGTTAQCEQALRKAFESEINRGKLIVFHQKRSWVDEEMTMKFLDVLSRQPSAPAGKVLVWDVFAAHRTQAVKDYAAELNIALKYIPAGRTGSLQPLDRRIFGDVKGRVGQLFHDRMMDGDTTISAVEAMRTWLAAWNSVEQAAIISSWDPILGVLKGFE
jgi:hypothetical protein